MARIVFEANGTEVWMKNRDSGSTHLAVVAKPIDGDYQGARERARVCAVALNDHQGKAEALLADLQKAG